MQLFSLNLGCQILFNVYASKNSASLYLLHLILFFPSLNKYYGYHNLKCVLSGKITIVNAEQEYKKKLNPKVANIIFNFTTN